MNVFLRLVRLMETFGAGYGTRTTTSQCNLMLQCEVSQSKNMDVLESSVLVSRKKTEGASKR